MTGRGVVRNDRVGAGLAEAEYNLGRCCGEGHGCQKNEEQAIIWFKRAEAQGIPEATRALLAHRAPAKAAAAPVAASVVVAGLVDTTEKPEVVAPESKSEQQGSS
ncbi:hypothetical protein HDU76_001583 [Blyttiomyces sp. JEL0837]|nr:hypothetical protein HDU76_001583 [Blyttiomyces sp. JEL0837]